MGYKKVKSKNKLLAEARANSLRNKLIAEGKINKTTKASEFSELELMILARGDLDNKLVTIDMTDYNTRIKRGGLSENFKNWLEENKDKQFIAHKMPNGHFSLEGIEIWEFTVFDLKLA